MRVGIQPIGPKLLTCVPGKWRSETILSCASEHSPYSSALALSVSAVPKVPTNETTNALDNIWALIVWSREKSSNQFLLCDALSACVNLPADRVTASALCISNISNALPHDYVFSGNVSEASQTGGRLTLTYAYNLQAGETMELPVPPQLKGYLIGTFVPPFATAFEISNFDLVAQGAFQMRSSDASTPTFLLSSIPSALAGNVASGPVRAKDNYFLIQAPNNSATRGQLTFRLTI